MRTSAEWTDARGCAQWKHEPLAWQRARCGLAANATGQDLLEDDDVWIVVSRHPLAWYLSMREHSYNLKCPAGEIAAPCLLNSLWAVHPYEYANMFDLYNEFYRDFAVLARRRPRNVVLFRYEDLVASREATLEALATAVCLASSATILKDDGGPATRVANGWRHPDCKAESCDYYHHVFERTVNETWRDEFEPGEIETICPLLEAALLEDLGYSCR